jgi:tellurite resistance protein TerC
MRAALIAAGVALVAQLHWALYLFGGFLVIIGAHGLAKAGSPGRIAGGRLLDWLRRHGRVAEAGGEGLLVRHRGVLMATPAGLALLLVEAADLVFAVDSVPAVLAISTDPFIVFTANAFAILGLRALYFALAGLLPRFRYLRHGLALLLVLIGAKMLLADIFPIPTVAALAATVAVLIGAIALSLMAPREALTAAPSRPH